MLAAAGTAAFLIACATQERDWKETARPGFYDLRGWNNWGADINGEVGHRLYVSGPGAWCLPSRQWSGEYRILSGRLPPGLSVDNGFNITGIPSERGHWIVSLELYNIVCGGNTYRGLTQELRFHITGSGRVVQ